MESRQIIASLAMGLALATATTASAEDAGWYFGVTGGQAQADLSKDALDAVVVDTLESVADVAIFGSSNLEDSDTSLSLFGGYRFSPYFAVEAGYVDFGTVEYRADGDVVIFGVPGSFPATFSADIESKGFTAAAVGTIPLNERFELHGRLGVLFADTEITETASIDDFSASDRYSANSQDFFYGVGAAVHLGQNWSISLDWQQFKDVGDDEDTGETDIDRISLGVIFRL